MTASFELASQGIVLYYMYCQEILKKILDVVNSNQIASKNLLKRQKNKDSTNNYVKGPCQKIS